MPDTIVAISGVAIADIVGLSGRAKSAIVKFGGVARTASIVTNNLEIWWDPHDGADSNTYITGYSGLTLENKAAVNGYSSNGGISETMYGDHRVLNAATSVFTTVDNRGVISLDGTNDTIISRESQFSAYNWDYPTSGNWILNTWEDLSASNGSGWTVELWFKRNGSWGYLANIFSCYNEAFRFRVENNKLVGVGMKIGSSTWYTNIDMSSTGWQHLAITFDPSLSSNHMKVYKDGELAAQRSGTSSISKNSWIQNRLQIGSYQTSGSERAKMYVGAHRKYIVPLTATEVGNNYNVEKGNYDI